MNVQKKNIFSILSFALIISFFLGFYFNENSAGGGEGDFDHILNNYNLIFSGTLNSIDWLQYRDSRFPIDYYIFKFYFPADPFFWKLNIFVISLITPFLLFFTIQKKILLSNNFDFSKNYLLLISLFLFISPYFRTSAFWMLRENVGFFYWIISIYFYYNLIYKDFNLYNLIISFFFSYLTFYSSVNLFIVPLTSFFLIFRFDKLFSKKNLVLIFINLIFLSPIVIFYDFFKDSLQYIQSDEVKRINFSYYKIVDFFAILLIYILPIFFCYFNFQQTKKILTENYIKIFFFVIFFIFIFWNYSNDDLLSGGAVRKLINIIIENDMLFKLSYLGAASISLLMSFYLAYKKERILFYILVPYSFFFCFINYVFQEYLDPLFLLFIILYSKNFLYIIKNKVIHLMTYFFLFYLSSLIYYNYFV